MNEIADIRSFQDLVVWQRSIELTSSVYAFTREFPKDEVFGLSSQLRRACVSVASNIAEGSGRGTTRDFLKFLHMARGSLYEVQTQLIIARKLRLGDVDTLIECEGLLSQVSKMLGALIRSLQVNVPKPTN